MIDEELAEELTASDLDALTRSNCRGRAGSGRRVLRHPAVFNASTAMLAVLILLAVLAPLITTYDPIQADLGNANLAPSAKHLFGTDASGMDVLTRVLYAARTDLTLSILAIVAAMAIGLLIGSAAAFLGGWFDEVASRMSEMIQSIPLFLFSLMVVASLGSGRVVIGGIIAVFYAPAFFKVTRSVAGPTLQADFVAAAHMAGRTRSGIILRHVVPNALGSVLGQLSVNTGFAIQLIAGLSFLGLGLPLPQPEWGAMISAGASRIAFGEWWIAVFPGLAIFITVISLDGIGRRLTRLSER